MLAFIVILGGCRLSKNRTELLNICINEHCFNLMSVDSGYMNISASQLYVNDIYGTLNNGDNTCQPANQVIWMFNGTSIDSCEYIGLNYLHDTLVCMQINLMDNDKPRPSIKINDTFSLSIDQFDSQYLSEAFTNYTFIEETRQIKHVKYRVIYICANRYKDYNCWLVPFCP